MHAASATHHTDVFDLPTRWRAEAAEPLGLNGDDLIAGLSPGAAFPAALRTVGAALAAQGHHVDLLVDVGAGAGGASEWLRRTTGAVVIAVEPAAIAACTAARAFPHLRVVRGRGGEVPVSDGVADALSWCGVLSLVPDPRAELAEARRVLRAGGALAIADLWSSGADDVRSGPNVFRSVESMRAELACHGFSASDVGIGPPSVTVEWSEVAEAVDAWIDQHRGHHPAHAAWSADRRHLRRHVDRGDVVGGCVVARARERDRAADDLPGDDLPAVGQMTGGAGAVGSGIGGSAGIGVGTGSSGRSGNGRVGGGSVGASNIVDSSVRAAAWCPADGPEHLPVRTAARDLAGDR
jgi:SAM-dependent methyltransferase